MRGGDVSGIDGVNVDGVRTGKTFDYAFIQSHSDALVRQEPGSTITCKCTCAYVPARFPYRGRKSLWEVTENRIGQDPDPLAWD